VIAGLAADHRCSAKRQPGGTYEQSHVRVTRNALYSIPRQVFVARWPDFQPTSSRTYGVWPKSRVPESPVDNVYTRVYNRYVVERIRYNFFIEQPQREGLRLVKERDGISESEQIRRAINAWLESKGVTAKAAPRRVSPRRKA
jgi:hypothetical protein